MVEVKDLKIGLVLSGGFAKGASQFGFMQAMIDKLGLGVIKVISTSSIGVINGLAIACDTMENTKRIWEEFHCNGIFSIRKMLKKTDVVNNIFDKIACKKIEIPTYVSLCRVPQFSVHYYYLNGIENKDETKKVVDIALTYPFVNGLIKRYNKKMYLDGGLIDNIPINPIIDYNLDLILILHCDPHYVPPAFINKLNKTVIDIDVTLYNKGPNKTFSLSHSNLVNMLDSGYQYGVKFCDEVLLSKDLNLKERAQKFITNEACPRRNKYSLLTIVTVFNNFHNSRGFK